MASVRQGQRFLLVGNRLCIDFANSSAPLGKADPLASWANLVDFLEAAGAVDHLRGNVLRRMGDSRASRAALDQARRLRQTMLRALPAMALGKPVSGEHIHAINRLLAAAESFPQLTEARVGRYRLELRLRRDGPRHALLPIARSAAELIAEGPAAPVRRCANPKCVLYFYDDSRNGLRRWCSMQACGNRRKVATFSKRQRALALRRGTSQPG